MDSRQGVVLQFGVWCGANNHLLKKLDYYETFQCTLLGLGWILWGDMEMDIRFGTWNYLGETG
jgi:hypothetical protein